MSQQRQLAAILFTDIVGYTAVMQEDEQKAVALIKHYHAALDETVGVHEGKILNYYGDGSLCTFQSVTEAVNCAIDLQKELQSAPSVPLRIGLHVGEIFFEDGKALGDSVNVASRIQSLGEANTILFSKEVFDKIKNHPEFKAVSLGHFDFKNVDEPVEVFALANEGLIVPKREQMSGKLKHDLSKNKKVTRRNLMIAAMVPILLIGGTFLYTKYFNNQNVVIEKSIAVLPFRNISNDSLNYFADGMMDEILNNLYKIGGLNVIPQNSLSAYKASKKSYEEIADELGVANLLDCSVQKDGDSIRIIGRLINGKTGQQLWGDTYHKEFKDVFFIQSIIAQQIAAALKVKIDPETKSRVEYVPTTNTSAYNLYLQSKEAANNGDFNRWKELLEKTTLLDSNFAPAYADQGFYWLGRGSYGGDLNAKQVLYSALPLLQRSIQLDSNLASGYYYMALVHLWYKWDFKTAEKEWRKFFQLNPSGLGWESNYEDFLNASGRFHETIDFSLKIRDQDKSNFGKWKDLALNYIYVNQPNKGMMILDSALLYLKNPDNKEVSFSKAWLSIYLGMYQQSIDNLNKLFEVNPRDYLDPKILSWLAISYYHISRLNESEKIMDSLKSRSKNSSVGSPSYHLAIIYASTGRKELALQWLQKAYTDHEVEMYWLKVEPLFNPLRNDPRFKELLTKMGFQ